jgi:hypothetical protein
MKTFDLCRLSGGERTKRGCRLKAVHDPQSTWAAKDFSLRIRSGKKSFFKLLLQFRESRIDPRKYRGLPELREDTLCLSQMLEREGTLFLDLVK